MARQISVEIFVILAIGIVLGLFGPFGTYAYGTAMRIAFWLAFALVGYAIFRPLIIAGTWMSQAFGLPRIVGIGIAQVVAAVPLTFVIALFFAEFDFAKALKFDWLGQLYLQVWLIGFLVRGFFSIAFREVHAIAEQLDLPPSETGEANTAAAERVEPSLHDRLPAGFGPVLALNSEDHYVRVFGQTREELLLIRLRDAIAELQDADGLQVHRSWWVAKDAVAQVDRGGRTARITLVNGCEVPVSRDNMATLNAARWKGMS